MIFSKVVGRHAILESEETNGVKYEIYPNSFYEGVHNNGFICGMNTDRIDIDEGYLDKIDNNVTVCCGYGLACAAGVPSVCIEYDIEELKKWAEEHFRNL